MASRTRHGPSSESLDAREWADVQGLLVHGYKHMRAVGLLLLKVEDARRCGRWLAHTASEVTSAAHDARAPLWPTCRNLALSRSGLEALGLGEALETFPSEFLQGMAARHRELGDTDEDDPVHWDFGGTGPRGPRQQDVHLLLLLYARTEARLDELLEHERARLAEGGLREVSAQRGARLHDAEGQEVEPFGFRDSLSQPTFKGLVDPEHPPASYDAPLNTGELLLGYTNEYDEVPQGPRVRAALDVGEWLRASRSGAGWRELGRNGSFLVLRKLAQDVEGFEAFIREHPLARTDGRPDARKARWLKAKLVGRWPNGAPLRPGQYEEPRLPQGAPDNGFLYVREDAEGQGCPVTSHVRRANPRDSLPPTPALSLKVTRRSRILRRGVPYRDEAGQGLLFMALNASIGRQFEFIQRNWLMSEKHGGLDDRDFVSHGPPGQVTLPGPGVRQRVQAGLSRFVRTRGGGYFFLPGLGALQFLADLAVRQPSP